MNLEEFVAQTLTQIVAGVREATQRIDALGTNARVNPQTIRSADDAADRQSIVEFDVAVTVVDQEDATARDKISASAGILAVVSAKLSGESGNEKTERQRNEIVSRVRFQVALAQPSQIDDRSQAERDANAKRAENAALRRRTVV